MRQEVLVLIVACVLPPSALRRSRRLAKRRVVVVELGRLRRQQSGVKRTKRRDEQVGRERLRRDGGQHAHEERSGRALSDESRHRQPRVIRQGHAL
eukprot:840399-Prymnesium_polylepis.1